MKSDVQLSIMMLHAKHRSHLPDVLIEGDKASLKHLAKIILNVANGDDCGFQISPRGPGNLLFTEFSEMGLYVHRLPCSNGMAGGKEMSAAIVAKSNAKRAARLARKTIPRKRA